MNRASASLGHPQGLLAHPCGPGRRRRQCPITLAVRPDWGTVIQRRATREPVEKARLEHLPYQCGLAGWSKR